MDGSADEATSAAHPEAAALAAHERQVALLQEALRQARRPCLLLSHTIAITSLQACDAQAFTIKRGRYCMQVACSNAIPVTPNTTQSRNALHCKVDAASVQGKHAQSPDTLTM